MYVFFGEAKTKNMNRLICVNEEIESVSLYTIRPLLLHGYVLPFVLLYGGWLYVWVAVLGFNDYLEAGYIGFVIIGLLQVVCALLCHWFVNVRCLLTCNRVRVVFDHCVFDNLDARCFCNCSRVILITFLQQNGLISYRFRDKLRFQSKIAK